MIEQRQLDLGDISAPLCIRINRRARRMILSVDAVHGQVRVTIPKRSLIDEAIVFAKERREWILAQLGQEQRAIAFGENSVVPYLDEGHTIIREGGPRNRIRIEPGTPPSLIVGGEQAHINRRVVDWLKKQARATLTNRVDHHCVRLNVKRSGIKIRDTRTRWGSCSSQGVLSFSWRLILAPPCILDYVAAHECSHLVHMNHSPAFWRLLASLDVDARHATNWFDEHGAGLFRYGVDDKIGDHSAGLINATNGSSLAGAA